jgi:NAD+ kinase
MTCIVLVSHPGRPDAHQLAIELTEWLCRRGHTTVPLDQLDSGEVRASELGLVVSLGGDGTMLRAVDLLAGAPVPLLGVNMGRLGYLTEVEPPQVYDALERFERGAVVGEWLLDERMMLDIAVTDESGARIGTYRALNEAVVEKCESGHTVNLLASIDSVPFTSYAADGLIVATPTGSTAYALSARGPIVSPKHRAMLLTPVAPHMLFDRTIVLDPSERIDIEVIGDRQAAIAIDGQPRGILSPGAIVTCTPSAATARFLRFGGHSYHLVLKAKFGLSDR